jgi:hypothetical protein
MTSEPRPVFVVHLRPEPRVDAIRALRHGLKTLHRRFGLRAVSVVQDGTDHAVELAGEE